MLGAEFVEQIHDELVATLWPETDPIAKGEYRNRELIESATARPFHSVFGQDAYPTVTQKAVALFHSLISNHPFYNGNKRTAVIAFDDFLLANGYVLLLTNDQMYRLAEQTASYKVRGLSHDQSFAEIIATLEGMIVPLDVVKREKVKDPKLVEFYQLSLQIRRGIRRNKLNRLMSIS